jgi:4-hydroxybenzoate polyprenyltransferase
MRKTIGLALFCMGIGIAIDLFINSNLLVMCLMALFLILGYNLFCN